MGAGVMPAMARHVGQSDSLDDRRKGWKREGKRHTHLNVKRNTGPPFARVVDRNPGRLHAVGRPRHCPSWLRLHVGRQGIMGNDLSIAKLRFVVNLLVDGPQLLGDAVDVIADVVQEPWAPRRVDFLVGDDDKVVFFVDVGGQQRLGLGAGIGRHDGWTSLSWDHRQRWRAGRAECRGRWEMDTRNNTVKDKDKVSREMKPSQCLMPTASKTVDATSLMPWRSLSGGGEWPTRSAQAPEKGGAGNNLWALKIPSLHFNFSTCFH